MKRTLLFLTIAVVLCAAPAWAQPAPAEGKGFHRYKVGSIEVTAREIARVGLERVTLRDIARAGGWTTGIVSHYFVDKRELMIATFRSRAGSAGPGAARLRPVVTGHGVTVPLGSG